MTTEQILRWTRHVKQRELEDLLRQARNTDSNMALQSASAKAQLERTGNKLLISINKTNKIQ